MRKREREKLIKGINSGAVTKQGFPMTIRPYESDVRKLSELAKSTGETRAAIARKLIQKALSEHDSKLKQERFENKIDWIIRTERENQTDLRNLLSLFDGLNEQTERLSDNVKSLSDDSLNTTVLLREAYCMLNITVSSLNQIFTRLLEFLSPNQSERENSIDIGNAFLANLIAHSILDLNKCHSFHGLETEPIADANLFVETKIKVLQERIAANAANTKSKKDEKS
ncbi:MAG: hypothetical protein KF756_14325 [Acidobacteria bacterium]|nr:hypothetical protein [Acidobacteriota bacterium]